MFDVSLVSEALRILEAKGLVSVQRGNRGGAVVHAPAKAGATYALGLLLESERVRLNDLTAGLCAQWRCPKTDCCDASAVV